MEAKRFSRISCVVVVLGVWAMTGCDSWNRTFGGPNHDVAYSVVQASDRGYLVAGVTESFGGGGEDLWLIKVDALGIKKWAKTYGGTSDDRAYCIKETTDGGYIITGRTGSSGAGDDDVWLLKTDSLGNVLWDKTFGGASHDVANSVVETDDGGYLLAGETSSYGAGLVDFWVIKTDGSGNREWDKTFGRINYDWANAVARGTDGGYLVVGGTMPVGSGSADFWLIKIDALGNKQWDRVLGGAGHDVAASVAQTADGGYVVAGETGSYGAGRKDFWLLKVDASGNEEINKTFGGSDSENAYSVAQTADGGYILAGETGWESPTLEDIWLVKTDASGNEQWARTFGGSNMDWANSVAQTADGGYIVAGRVWLSETDWDVSLIKTDAEGNAPPVPAR